MGYNQRKFYQKLSEYDIKHGFVVTQWAFLHFPLFLVQWALISGSYSLILISSQITLLTHTIVIKVLL